VAHPAANQPGIEHAAGGVVGAAVRADLSARVVAGRGRGGGARVRVGG